MPSSQAQAAIEATRQRPAAALTRVGSWFRGWTDDRVSSWSGSRLSAWTGDRLSDRRLASLVFLLALLIRLPYLQQIPRFNDEVTLWRFAVELGQPGAALPLVFEDTGYNGALLIYLLAALHKLTQAIWAPRLLALLSGSAIVLASYLLGRSLQSRLAGLVAAAFMAITFTPILVYSHVLHMAGLALMFQVFAWWAAARTAAGGSGYWLVAAAALAGLAVQTHPLSAAFIPGLFIWLWLQPEARRRLRSRWSAWALAALLLAYSPIIAYHLPSLLGQEGSRLSGVAEDLGEGWHEAPYHEGVINLLGSMADALGGIRHGAATPLATDGFTLLLLAAALASVFYAARRGQSLPFWLLLSALLCMPLLIRDYDNTLLARYSGLTLPAIHLAFGLAAASWLASGKSTGSRILLPILIAGALLGLGTRLAGHYAGEMAGRRSNADLLRIAALAEGQDSPVVLDGQIKRTSERGSGPSAVLQGIFAWRGTAFKKYSDPEDLDNYLLAITWPAHVIVSDAARAQLRAQLEPIEGGRVEAKSDVDGWGLYRLVPVAESDPMARLPPEGYDVR